MCSICDAYADSLPTRTPEQLDALVERVRTAEGAGDLDWLDGDKELLLRVPNQPLPDASHPLKARWMCSACSRLFLLEVGSQHAVGDGWRPLFGN